MDLTLDKTTHIGLGHATRADAFQGGREAAQMAKSQIPSGTADLVLVFGPGNVHFKDFIEGVRLVCGEDTLVGIPVSHVLSTEKFASDSCCVLILQSSRMHFSIASQDHDADNVLFAATSVVSQFRQIRGNLLQNFEHHGLLLFHHDLSDQKNPLAFEIAADLGLETWMAGGAMALKKANLVGRNKAIPSGVVGIECLSQEPWGIGLVGTSSFPNNNDIHKEAAKSATRQALTRMGGHPAAFGFIFFDFSNTVHLEKAQDILDSAAQIAPRVPLIGIPTIRRFVRCDHRSLKIEEESVVAVLVPS